MRAALRNGEALLDEARLLSDAGHPARAAALAILAHEELGKIPPFANANQYAKAGKMGKWWKSFRSHVDKSASEDLLTLCIIIDTVDPNLIEPTIVGETAKYLNHIKKLAIYTDFKNNSFVCPLDNDELAGLDEKLIAYVDTTLQLHRAIVSALTPEFLAAFWEDPVRQQEVDEDVQAFHAAVVSRWAGNRFAPPRDPADAL